MSSTTATHPGPRTPEDRLSDLELAVFGNPRQRIPGLVANVDEIKTIVKELRDNRMVWVQLIAQAATFVAALAALIVALR